MTARRGPPGGARGVPQQRGGGGGGPGGGGGGLGGRGGRYDGQRTPPSSSSSPPQRVVEGELRNTWSQDDYLRQMTRRWRPGDVYAPHDLSPSEMGKWRRNRARKQDLVDMLGLRPLDMYRVGFLSLSLRLSLCFFLFDFSFFSPVN